MDASISYELSSNDLMIQYASVCDYFNHSMFSFDIFRSSEFDTFRKGLNVIERDRSNITIPELTTKDSTILSPTFKCLHKTDVNNKTIVVQNASMLNKVTYNAAKKFTDNY